MLVPKFKQMKLLKISSIFISSVVLIFLGACSNGTKNPVDRPILPSENPINSNQPQAKGSQVIEVGRYHLELVTEKADNGTHIDFYLQTSDNREAIPNAKVTAEVESPIGSQKTLSLIYDSVGKHYAALLSDQTAGEYKVVILSEINAEKVNGRFTFNY